MEFNLSCDGVVEHLECHLGDTMAGTGEGHGPVSALQSRLRGRLMGLVQKDELLARTFAQVGAEAGAAVTRTWFW